MRSALKPCRSKLTMSAALALATVVVPECAWAQRSGSCSQFPPTPTTIYVGTNNVAGTGTTAESPFAAFSSAHTCAIANDVIVILGKYTLVSASIRKDDLTIRGQARSLPGGGVEASEVTCPLTSSGLPATYCFNVNDWWLNNQGQPPSLRKNITIQDLNIAGGSLAPIVVGFHVKNITIERNTLAHASGVGAAPDSGYGIYQRAIRSSDPNVPPDQDPKAEGIHLNWNKFSRPTSNTAIYSNGVDGLEISNNTIDGVVEGDGIVVNDAMTGSIYLNHVSNLTKNLANGPERCSPHELATGIKVRDSHFVGIVDNTITQVTGAGIMVRPTSFTTSQPSTRIDVVHNTVTGTVNFNAPKIRPTGCKGGWPSAVVLSHVSDFTAVDNTIEQNWGEGLALNTSTFGTVEHNTLRDNFSVNIYLNNASDSKVLRNYTSYTAQGQDYYRDEKAAQGIALANERNSEDTNNFIALKNLYISNNIVRGGKHAVSHYTDNLQNSIYHYSGMQNVRIFNNTFYGGFRSPVINVASVSGSVTAPHIKHQDIHINANIFYQSSCAPERAIADDAVAATQFKSNIWFTAVNTCLPGQIINQPYADPLGDTRVNPLLANPGIDDPVGYKIGNASSARNTAAYSFPEADAAGLDYFGTTRPASQKDVGAHEVIGNLWR